MSKSRHIYSLDFLRVLATFGVVIIHVFSNENFPVNHSYSTFEWIVREFIVISFRWVVPVFVMLSGALMLNSNKKELYWIFLRKRFSRIGIPLLAWSAIYYFFFNMIGQDRTLEEHLKLTFVDGYPAYHLYFIFIVAGLYLVTPVFKKMMNMKSIVQINEILSLKLGQWPGFYSKMTDYFLQWVITIMILILSSAWAMNLLWVKQAWHFSGLYSVTFWIPFVGYYLLGYLLSKMRVHNTKHLVLSIFFIIITMLFGSFILKSNYGYSPRGLVFHDYLNPLTIFLSSCLFIVAFNSKKFTELGKNKLIQLASNASFGIYLGHWIVLYFVNIYIYESNLFLLTLKSGIVFFVSCLLVVGMMKVSVGRKIVGGR